MSNRFFFISDSHLESISGFIGSHLDSPSHLSYSGINKLHSCIDYLDIKNDVSFVLEASGNIRGVFLAAYRGQKGYIPLIVVHKEYRRRGYGKVLLQKGLSFLAEAGCKEVILEVLSDNKQAISLYRSEGFKMAESLLTYRTDSASYYRGTDSRVGVRKEHSFTFQPLYRNYTIKKKPWIRSLMTLQTILDSYGGELYSILFNNKTVGYIVLQREQGAIRILDMALEDYHRDLISYSLAGIGSGEKIVVFRCLYGEEELARFCEDNGFYLQISQYEMTKELR